MKRLALLALLFALPVAAQVNDTRFVSATPTADTSAYATGDLIGGKLTFTGACPSRSGTGYVISAQVTDKAAQAQDLDLVLFESDPTGTTFTDQAAFDPADGDLSKVLAVLNFGSTSRFAFADNGTKYIGTLAIPVRCLASSAVTVTFYGALVSRGTPTFASASDVTVKLGIAGD